MPGAITNWEHPGFASTQAAGQVVGMIDPADLTYRPMMDADLATGNTVLRAFRTAGAILAAATLLTTASAAAAAGLRLPHGAAPTAPVNGDIWSTTSGFFGRVNGVTVPLTSTTDAGALTSGNLAYARLPIGSGAWDTGAATTLTLTRALTVGGLATLSAGLNVTGTLLVGTTSAGNAGTGGIRTTGTNDFTAASYFADGSATAPGLAFGLDGDTGFFRPGADQIGIVAGGGQVGQMSGALVWGTVNSTNLGFGDIRSSGRLWMADGAAAPTATVGYAAIYVDSADGDLKVRFADGITKTLATDT